MSEPEIKPREGMVEPGTEEAGREEGQRVTQHDGRRGPRTDCAKALEASGGIWCRHQGGGGYPAGKITCKFEIRLLENSMKERQLLFPRKTKSCTKKM